MAGTRYVLDGVTPRECPNLAHWKKWFHVADRRVAVTAIDHHGIVVTVNSEFVGIDPSPDAKSPPKLFVTTVFGGPLGGKIWRGTTWHASLYHHAAAVGQVMQALGADDDSVDLPGMAGSTTNWPQSAVPDLG
jgi:hypothetical protein